MDELLSLLRKNALESPDSLAKKLSMPVADVKSKIAEYERRGVIRGYQAVVNEDQLDFDHVTALVEVKLAPAREGGLNKVALRLCHFPEVYSAYMVSGAFDLLLFVTGRNIRDVATFISEKLSTTEGVTAVATHFQLKTYKHHGVLMEGGDEFDRLQVSP